MKTAVLQIRILLAPVAVFIGMNIGYSKTPYLTEYDQQSSEQARSAPLVIVGVADSDAPIGRPRPSRVHPGGPMLLHRVRVQVENVLKGSLDERTIFVYYFGFTGGDGPPPLGFGLDPSRRILWLRRDAGALRMACDGWDVCSMFVDSGAHPHYIVDPRKPLEYALVDVLFTRGEGAIDNARFARELGWSIPAQAPKSHVIEKLGYLALTEPSVVKAAACNLIRIYSQDRIDASHRQQAKDALKAARCD